MHLCIYIYISIYIYIYIHTHIYIYMCVCVYVYVRCALLLWCELCGVREITKTEKKADNRNTAVTLAHAQTMSRP